MDMLTVNLVAVVVAPPFGIWDLAISVLAFTAVALLVVAVFGQSGSVEISPQREAAIATGHTDRRTVFENTWLRPFVWPMLAIAHRLAMPRMKSWMRRMLVAAGNPNYYTAEEYLALGMLVGMSLGAVSMVTQGLLGGGLSIVVSLLVGLVLGTVLSIYYLYSRAGARIQKIAKRIPYALDLIGLAMGAGASFTEAVNTVARENRTDPFNIELNSLLAEIDLGATRRKALQNLADRIPLDALRSIVASIIQAEELGTPLGEVLRAQANLMRLHRSVRAENAAAVASVRILVPSLLILISVVIMVFAPMVIRIVQGGGLF